MNQYSPSEFIATAYAWAVTKLCYPKARLIRRPFYIRGKRNMQWEPGLTTGHGCRFDLPGHKKALVIGRNCKLGDYVHIVASESVTLGQDCLLASHIFISDTSHGIYDNTDPGSNPQVPPDGRKLHAKAVTIGSRVWIGENVCILPGVTVGDGCIIGANSVVTKDMPKGCIAVGSPAQVIKTWNDEKGNWEYEENQHGRQEEQENSRNIRDKFV